MKNRISILTLLIVLAGIAFFSCNKLKPTEPCCVGEITFGGSMDTLTIYNVITPNGDGYNDMFLIDELILVVPLTITIVDFDNNVLFKSNSYQNNFNGETNDGDPIPEGKYKTNITHSLGSYGFEMSIVRNKMASPYCGKECMAHDSNDPLL